MDKLPQSHGFMKVPEALLLEVLGLLVDEGIVSEAAAVKRYKSVKKRYPGWK